MYECQNCNSERLMNVSGKCNDLCSLTIGEMERNDYVPDFIGIGGGDYIAFEYCLDCGRIQGDFPIEKIDEL